jgi:hypothetical protein
MMGLPNGLRRLGVNLFVNPRCRVAFVNPRPAFEIMPLD